jgi:hypothetical protein
MIRNKLNNKKYVGITSRAPYIRFNEHLSGQQTLVGIDMNKFGKENFELIILETNIPDNEKDEKERYYISSNNSLYPNGYNKSTGGVKGKDLNEISRSILSESSKGVNNSRCHSYINQIDMRTGEIVNIFGSAREAARHLGDESKYRAILYCLNGKSKSSYGYNWKYECG